MTKWMTREHPRVDRVVCPWLIEKFIDKNAEFLYVPADSLMDEAKKQGATPYDGKKGVEMEFGHHGAKCSFDAFVEKYDLAKDDPAMAYMCLVIRGADTEDKTWSPESPGLEAILEGVRELYYPDDQAQRKASYPVVDALYAFCKKKAAGKFVPSKGWAGPA